jgi:hypothetical protein
MAKHNRRHAKRLVIRTTNQKIPKGVQKGRAKHHKNNAHVHKQPNLLSFAAFAPAPVIGITTRQTPSRRKYQRKSST